MSKEEFLKIQTCVLKVNIHCDGCKHKVKKILQKIDGVYTINIDSDLGKVTVSGNVDPPTLIKKLGKNGKHAELWAKPNQNQSQNPQNQSKNMKIDNGKGGNGTNPPKEGQNGQKGMGGINPPKGGGQNGQIPNQQQMMQQMKAFQDMKLPQLKDIKMPMGPPPKDQNQKNVKFDLPEEEDDLSDGEFDDEYYDDEDDFDDDGELDYEDEMDDLPPKMKPLMGNGQIPPIMMMNPQMIGKIGNLGGGGEGQNGKKDGPGGGGGTTQIPISDGKEGKKGGGGGGGNGNSGQNQGGGKNGKGGGGEGKMGNNGGGGAQGKGNGGGGQNGNLTMNGGKKGGGMSDGIQGLPNMGGPNVGQLGNMPMGPMGQGPMLMGQFGQLPAVQGLPANAMGGGGGGGYFAGAGPEATTVNPYQQQIAAMMMNQQRANGNEQFQPMIYERPPPAVNYMPPYPYPYPYSYPPPGEPYAHGFSDENTSSCIVM